MKIGYEAKRVFRNFTGLGNYARSVVEIMAKQYPESEFILYTPKETSNSRTNFISQIPNISVKVPKSKLLKSWWRSFGIVNDLKKDRIDLFHGLSNEIPFGLKKQRIPSIVTIHDLIFLRYPQYFNYLDRKIYYLKFKFACNNADKIIAISQQTKRDIIQFFKTDPRKIEVVYQGCDPIFSKEADPSDLENIKQKWNLPDQFILCVGTIESRKNQLLILQAIKGLDINVKAVLVGKPKAFKNDLMQYLSENGLQDRVLFLENIPFNELPSIYQLSKIFVYPSFFEGFGIPILEALNSGVPVIAATGSCLEEAGGPNSIYVDPTNSFELIEKIKLIFDDETLKQEMIDKGKMYANQFREAIIAKNLMTVYQETIDNA